MEANALDHLLFAKDYELWEHAFYLLLEEHDLSQNPSPIETPPLTPGTKKKVSKHPAPKFQPPKIPEGAFLKITTPDGRVRYECTVEGCRKQFSRRGQNAKSHYFAHNDIRPFQCDQCPATFTRAQDCTRHLEAHNRRAEGEGEL
ncbi:hypothetical protein EDD86DRAFT_117279 [Gorgonomyces haynaldii]|nr:hypothetical protein EDD86DRAFT_117279 [Gorgonomyces haynaldii]